MKTIEYRTMDKSAWGPGPWQSEPDKRQWQDEATGLPCLIVRNRVGGLCGYVGVSEGHPSYEKDYDNAGDFEVHGGLTFANHCQPGDESKHVCHKPEPGEPDHVWWLGFDCVHCFDIAPGMDRHGRTESVYRDFAYVAGECASLAKQLVAVKAL